MIAIYGVALIVAILCMVLVPLLLILEIYNFIIAVKETKNEKPTENT